MSMSVRCEGCGLRVCRRPRGTRRIRPAAPPHRPPVRPDAVAGQAVPPARIGLPARHRRRNLTTYGEFLEREGFSGYFIAHYAVPVVSCVWSAGRETTLAYPARYLFRFLDHHGMLRVERVTPVVHRRRRVTRPTSSGSPGCSRTCARPMPSPTSPGARTASRSGTSPGRSPAWTASSSRPTPIRPSACSPTRTMRRSAPSSNSATRATSPFCTPTARSCQTPRGPGRAGTTG